MAIIITTDQVFVPLFDGNQDLPEAEQIRFKHRHISLDDVFTIQTETQVNLLGGGFEFNVADVEQMKKHWGLIKAIIDKYTFDWEHVTLNEVDLTTGPEVTSTLGLTYVGLFVEVFNFLLTENSGDLDEAKNSEAASEPTLPESSTTAEAA